MSHSIIRMLVREGSSQRKILKKLANLLKNVEYKKYLTDAI